MRRWAFVVLLGLVGSVVVAGVRTPAQAGSSPYFANYGQGVDGCRGASMTLQGSSFDAGVSYVVDAAADGTGFYSTQETAGADGTVVVTIHDIPVDLAPGDAVDVSAATTANPATTVASYQFHIMGPHIQASGFEGYGGYYFKLGEAVHLWGTCFRPDTSVTVTSPDIQLEDGSATGAVDGTGQLTITPTITSIVRTGTATLSVTEDATGVAAVWKITLAEAQLTAGTALDYRFAGALISPSGHYRFNTGGPGSLAVDRYDTSINSPPSDRIDVPVQTPWMFTAPDEPESNWTGTVRMRDNGNLVDRTGSGTMLWSSHTSGRGGTRVRIQDDGNLVMRTSAGVAIWSTKNGFVRHPTLSSGDVLKSGQALVLGRTQFVLQHDGNVVVYRSGVARWSTNTAGRGGTRLTMRTNGNLVLTRENGTIVCSSRTADANASNHVTVLRDGDVVMYDALGRVVWHTNTAA